MVQSPPPSILTSGTFCKHMKTWLVGTRCETEAKVFWFSRAPAKASWADRSAVEAKTSPQMSIYKQVEPQENRNVGPFLWKHDPGFWFLPKTLNSMSGTLRRTRMCPSRHHPTSLEDRKAAGHATTTLSSSTFCVFSVRGVRTSGGELFRWNH